MTKTQEEAVTEAAADIVREFMSVRWYWTMGELEVKPPDHDCTADCEHWEKGASD